jgi:hypothetical protein
MKNLSTVEEILFNFLRTSIQQGGAENSLVNKNVDIKKAFTDLLEMLKPLEKNKLESRAFMYLDIISWLESKIQDKEVQAVIQEKFVLGNS